MNQVLVNLKTNTAWEMHEGDMSAFYEQPLDPHKNKGWPKTLTFAGYHIYLTPRLEGIFEVGQIYKMANRYYRVVYANNPTVTLNLITPLDVIEAIEGGTKTYQDEFYEI